MISTNTMVEGLRDFYSRDSDLRKVPSTLRKDGRQSEFTQESKEIMPRVATEMLIKLFELT